MTTEHQTYVIWRIYDPHKENYARYYVVNRLEKTVQSSWSTLAEARAVAYDLNRRAS